MTQTDVPQLDSCTAWEELVQADKNYVSASMELLEIAKHELSQRKTLKQLALERDKALRAVTATGDALIETLKDALMDPRQRSTAIFVAQVLPPERLVPALSELLALATSFNGYAEAAKKLVLSLPKDWLITHVERFSEKLLPEASYEEYGGLIALYSQIDQRLALGLAQQATRHEDEDIRETGEDYLSKYQQT